VIQRCGRCLCGTLLVHHFSPISNAFIPCEQLQRAREARPSHADEPSGYPEVTDQTLETIRRRLRRDLDRGHGATA